MDVHPPHSPIHSIKEFLIHLLAITIGLLIALGLETTAEWFHHRHLVRDARVNLVQEMSDNRHVIERHLSVAAAETARLNQMLEALDAVEAGKPLPTLGEFNWSVPLLADSSWGAAQSTGATSYMSYAEAKRYAQVYTEQALYATAVDRYIEGRRQIFADLAHIQGSSRLSREDYEAARRNVFSNLVSLAMLHEVDGELDTTYIRLMPGSN